MKPFLLTIIIFLFVNMGFSAEPLRLVVSGLSHGHVDWIFNRKDKKDVQLVGVYETNQVLIDRYIKRYQLDESLFYGNLDHMLDQLKPQAIAAFGAISEHIIIARAAAPRGIHVMVEKPLATTLADAKEMQTLAQKHNVHILTNFETSWYQSNQEVKKLLEEGKLGSIKKVMVNDGHQGPKEIGVSDEFLDILTDPKKNGAGALVDFGCYGANLMTWLMDGQRPLSITAVTHQNKPHIYKNVDDEATIILQYPDAQCIIQGSWNWTFSRKDMEVYGDKGYAIAANSTTLKHRLSNNTQEEVVKLQSRKEPFNDPFSFLASVINGSISLEKNDLYGLPINVIAVEILEAAKKSANTSKTIFLK